MKTVQLTLACGSYDRTIPLQEGTVTASGIDITFLAMRPTQLFRRQARHAEFDASELSLSTYTILRSRGDTRMTAIPVFPSRKFRHSHIFVNGDNIKHPADLEGKLVGCPEFQNTATTWIRGILGDQYGVPASSIRWLSGGLNAPKREGDRIPLKVASNIELSRIGPTKYLSKMLEDGEIDALISANTPDCFGAPGSTVRRLITDYKSVEMDYYQQTGIFPIMHTVVIRTSLYNQYPWLAVNLMDAFEEAKRVGRERLEYPGALYSSLPWLTHHLEEIDELSGGTDLFAYGIEPNRHVLETFLGYSLEQGLIDRPLSVDELFAVETR
jgi:4,5-dihydroxyphthalate decarboxylase